MNDWPRVSQILKDMGLIEAGGPWYEPKHRRRGRLVDAACNLLGLGQSIDPAWWDRMSGERDDDRVAHEECRPFIEAYMQFLAETKFTMTHCAEEVKNTASQYVGHIDQLGRFPVIAGSPALFSLIDIKTGGESDWHRYQLALYKPAVIQTLGMVPARYNLYLTNDGKYRLVERKNPRDITEGQILAQAWWLTHGRKK